MSNQITGAQSLVKALEQAGVDVMFGIPGGAILPAYDPIYDSKIRHILVRHEQGAAFAADAYARVTGTPGVCLATSSELSQPRVSICWPVKADMDTPTSCMFCAFF